MSEFSKPTFISAAQTIDLRQRILRPNQTIEMCQYPEDSFSTTFHLGISLGNDSKKVISNGTFMQQSHELFPLAKEPYRLRGMATDFEFQRKGLGQLILNQAEVELKKRGCDLLWFNARTGAEEFYRKQNFTANEHIFNIELIGPHKVMYKWL